MIFFLERSLFIFIFNIFLIKVVGFILKKFNFFWYVFKYIEIIYYFLYCKSVSVGRLKCIFILIYFNEVIRYLFYFGNWDDVLLFILMNCNVIIYR